LKLNQITVSEENNEILRGLGHTSEIKDVIMVILNKVLQWWILGGFPPACKTHAPNGGKSTCYGFRGF